MREYLTQLTYSLPTLRSSANTFRIRYLIFLVPALGILSLWLRYSAWTNLVIRTPHSLTAMDQPDTSNPGNPPILDDEAIDFTKLNHVASLDSKYLPGSSSHPHSKDEARKRRLVFIGDIHGCLDELEALLAKVKYTSSHDHIIALGDVINKGPNSKGVVAFLMKHGASCVRGNHEDEVLSAAYTLLSPTKSVQSPQADEENDEDSKLDAKTKKRRARAQELARSFTRDQLKWLQTRPVILRVGEIKPFGNIVAVHAGLVPGVSLEKQDPHAVMNMRIIDVKTKTPSEKHSAEGSALWYNLWHEHEMSLHSHEKHTTVAYGHNKKKGMQIHRFTKGLDTGCVDGGKLTAWVVGLGKDEIVQVKSSQNA